MSAELQTVVASVREGYLLHYDPTRTRQEPDQDLALLTGDQCYATGLLELAEQGDLHNIGVLARLIAGGAQAHAGGDIESAEALWKPFLNDLKPSAS